MLRGGVRSRQTLVACFEDANSKRADNNNERRKEASFARGLSAARMLDNERRAKKRDHDLMCRWKREEVGEKCLQGRTGEPEMKRPKAV